MLAQHLIVFPSCLDAFPVLKVSSKRSTQWTSNDYAVRYLVICGSVWGELHTVALHCCVILVSRITCTHAYCAGIACYQGIQGLARLSGATNQQSCCTHQIARTSSDELGLIIFALLFDVSVVVLCACGHCLTSHSCLVLDCVSEM